ncbi:hypothetical protein OBCHQ24_18730 [Oceanobacillus iheyensis]|nr:hypothetical protein OBCHQ24_18730 [Oceanobacillus iheyensis]
MKNIFSKSISLLVVFSLVFTILGTSSISAEENIEKATLEKTTQFENLSETEVEVQGVKRAAIWFAGTAIGWIVGTSANSTIEYYTGTHPEEFAEMGVRTVESSIKGTFSWMNTDLHPNVYVTSYGKAQVRCPPRDTCPISSFNLEKE